MELESRGRLEDEMVAYADEFKLNQIIFPSFISQASYRLQYSASDVVFSTVGLLEANSTRTYTLRFPGVVFILAPRRLAPPCCSC